MTYSHAKVQGQRSVSSKDRVETDGWMEMSALPPMLMQSVTRQSGNLKVHVVVG